MWTSAPNASHPEIPSEAARDFDTLVTLFADDAIVIEYTTDLVGVEGEDEGEYIARVHLEGNFPGGTVDLHYRFTVDGDSIRRLAIAP